MEFKKIDDNKFECLLEKEDLDDNNISLDDFFKNDTAKIHGLLDAVMEEAHKTIDIVLDGGIMSLQLAPQPNQSILLTISSAKDEFGEMLHQAGERASNSLISKKTKGISQNESNVIKNPSDKLSAPPFKDLTKSDADNGKKAAEGKSASDNVVKAGTYVFKFISIDDVEDFCQQIPRTWGIHNELFKEPNESCYYLVLRKGRCAEQKYKNLSNILMEYAECEASNENRAYYLEEHCEKLISANAINIIKKYCGGSAC